jgi:predicted DNA-binding transcriptional regulator AlpA
MGANSVNHVSILADSPPVQMLMRPEWIRVDAAIQIFGLSRTKLYELIADRRIKSFCLRERNKIKGVRLISFDSLSEFLEREAREQQEALA